MKTLCITGSHPADLNFVLGILKQAGMTLAMPASRDPSLTVEFWHQEVVSRLKDMTNQSGEVEFGRVWEQLASDIFIANLDQPVWGWASLQSLPVLDFWETFDPQVRFVLVSTSVQRSIAHALEDGQQANDVKPLIEGWMQQHYQMLSFYHRHPQKTILVDIDHCIDQPAGLIKATHQAWQLGLKKVHFPEHAARQFPPLVRYLSEQLCASDHQWQALQNELKSSVTPIGTLWKTPVSTSIVEVLRDLQDSRQEDEVPVSQLQQKDKELEQALNKLHEAEGELKDKHAENEMLLAQLHQVQEELKQLYLKTKDTETMWSHKMDESQQAFEKVKNDNESLNKQLGIKKTELKQVSDKLASSEEKIKSLVSTQSELSKAREKIKALESASSQIGPLNDQIHQLTEENSSLSSRLKDAEEEGELILSQLHQVQEELEHYFLKFKDTEYALEAANHRWKRMVSRIPDYFDVGHISVSLEHESNDEPNGDSLTWTFKDLDATGRHLPTLTVKTRVEGGVACLEFARTIDDQPLFLRWPSVAKDDDSLTIAVMGDAQTGPKRVETLLQIGRSDWDLVQIVIAALIQSLRQADQLRLPVSVDTENLQSALVALKTRLNAMPPVFRFDELALKREQVNPDYEHLWLEFKHVAAGPKRLLDFDFRVSCANVRPNSFGEFPKLEFPEASGRSALTGWFDEAYDDFGAKLELRFSLPQSMDMQVWSQLSDADQQFLSSLISQLPGFLSELQASGTSVKRGWDEWQRLANEMQRILSISTMSSADSMDLLMSEETTKRTSKHTVKPPSKRASKHTRGRIEA